MLECKTDSSIESSEIGVQSEDEIFERIDNGVQTEIFSKTNDHSAVKNDKCVQVGNGSIEESNVYFALVDNDEGEADVIIQYEDSLYDSRGMDRSKP